MRQSKSYSNKNLVALQRDLIGKSLSSYQPNTWKILVFDAFTQSIISSQFKMKDLRDHNITLYISINQNREQIHGVTVLYLVEPTMANSQLIANDLISDKYTSVVVHFTGEPSPNVLSYLAKTVSSKKASLISRISKIQFSCLGYHLADNNMCILPGPQQLTNLIITLHMQPIFVFNPNDNSSKEMAENIKNRILTSYSYEELKAKAKNYCMIYIFNRQNDLFPILAHGITYGSLLENMFKINNIGTKIKDGSNITHELSLQDQIWVNKKNFLISQMSLQKQSNRIKSKLMTMSPDEYTQLNQKAKKIEWHINNADYMLKQAKKRRLNEFYDVELQIYGKKHLNKENFQDLIQLLKQGTNESDKIRIMMIYLHHIDSIDEIGELQAVFPQIKKNHKYNELKQMRLKGIIQESTSNKYIKKFAKGIWKNLITGQKKFRLTKQYEKIKSGNLSELIQCGLAIETIQPLPNNFSPAKISQNIVYSLGGVCFHQYANLIEADSDVLYCGDKLINFSDLI